MTKDDLKNESKFYISLINDFIIEVNKNENKEFTMEILISILIASLYEKDFDSLKKLRIKKDDINLIDIRENNLINLYSEIYLTQIQNCLYKIKDNKPFSKNKILILEIIILYFVKFNKQNISILFSSEDNKSMIINLFKFVDTYFLKEIKDEEIVQIIINQTLDLDNIINVLSKNNSYIEYLTNINNNFDTIYSIISSFKSIKEVYKKFTIDYKVSQLDDINKLVNLHSSLIEKQKKKGKYIINFIKIFEKYYNLYEKNNYILGICLLEKMVYDENKLFPKSTEIKKIDNKFKNKILSLLFKDKENKLNYAGEQLICILTRLRHLFSDKDTFNLERKNIILKYFITECKKK